MREAVKTTSYACFLSHYKAEAAMPARYIHDALEREIGRKVFLDSDNLRDVRQIQQSVCASDCFVIFLTPNVLSRPWCLIELHTAMKAGKPILGINLEGLHQGSYDFAKAADYLNNLEERLEPIGWDREEALVFLEKHGVDRQQAGRQLSQYLHSPIAIPYNTGWSKRMLDAAIETLSEEIKGATPRREMTAQMKTELVLNQWAARRRVKQDGKLKWHLKEFMRRRRQSRTETQPAPKRVPTLKHVRSKSVSGLKHEQSAD